MHRNHDIVTSPTLKTGLSICCSNWMTRVDRACKCRQAARGHPTKEPDVKDTNTGDRQVDMPATREGPTRATLANQDTAARRETRKQPGNIARVASAHVHQGICNQRGSSEGGIPGDRAREPEYKAPETTHASAIM